jgi:hypothetical protein
VFLRYIKPLKTEVLLLLLLLLLLLHLLHLLLHQALGLKVFCGTSSLVLPSSPE